MPKAAPAARKIHFFFNKSGLERKKNNNLAKKSKKTTLFSLKSSTMSQKAKTVTANATLKTNGEEGVFDGDMGINCEVVFLNLKEKPIMNEVHYTPQCVRARAWKYAPVTHNHPNCIFENAAVKMGIVTRAEWDEGAQTLGGSVFINYKMCREIGAEEIYKRLNAGEAMDVSMTCLLIRVNDDAGEVNGEKYKYQALEIEPISLAILPNQEGACSRPACGINEEETPAPANTLQKIRSLINQTFTMSNEAKPIAQNCQEANASPALLDAVNKLAEEVAGLKEQQATTAAPITKENLLEVAAELKAQSDKKQEEDQQRFNKMAENFFRHADRRAGAETPAHTEKETVTATFAMPILENGKKQETNITKYE